MHYLAKFLGLLVVLYNTPAFASTTHVGGRFDETSNTAQVQVRSSLRGAVFGFAPWGMTADGSPISGVSKYPADSYTGVMPDMIRAVAEAIGEPIELVPVSYSRMFALLRSGAVDFAFFFQSEASSAIAISLVKTHEMRTVVIARPDTVRAARGSINGLIFASPRSVLYEPAFDGNTAIKRIYTNDYTQAVKLLSKRRVSAIVGPEIFLRYSFNEAALEAGSYMVLKEITRNDVYLQFSRQSPLGGKMAKIAAAAQKYAEDGTFDRMLMEYFKAGNPIFQENDQLEAGK